MNLKFHNVRYHRNGVAGEGFYCVRFTYRDGRKNHDMQAIVFDHPGQCAVTTADPNERWRGDHFEDQIRAYIARESVDHTSQAFMVTA